MLSEEIYTKIALYCGEANAWQTFMHAGLMPTTGPLIDAFGYRKILMHGQVQSGKTAAIMEVLKKPVYATYRKVLVIQNSLLVLEQYSTRMMDMGLDFQIIDSKTKVINSNIVIVMRNKYRISAYLSICGNAPFIGLIDECDQTHLPQFMHSALVQFNITATPYKRYYKNYFQKVIQIPIPADYYGFNRLNIHQLDYIRDKNVFDKFVRAANIFIEDTKDTEGMLLLNHVISVDSMHMLSAYLSAIFTEIPIIVLSSKKTVTINGVISKTKRGAISKTIDSLNAYPRIIFIANILSLRGLSYTSSDFKRHLTHQYSRLCSNDYTSIIQRMRIFGRYSGNTSIHLIVDELDIDYIPKLMRKNNKTIMATDMIDCPLLSFI